MTIAVLLDKKVKRQTELEADYVGFECPDYFVVGYGMDVAYAFRELPFVGVVTGDAEYRVRSGHPFWDNPMLTQAVPIAPAMTTH